MISIIFIRLLTWVYLSLWHCNAAIVLKFVIRNPNSSGESQYSNFAHCSRLSLSSNLCVFKLSKQSLKIRENLFAEKCMFVILSILKDWHSYFF